MMAGPHTKPKSTSELPLRKHTA